MPKKNQEDVTEKEWSPDYPVPKEEHEAYRLRIAEEMEKVKRKMQEVEKQPFDEKKIWAKVGQIRYGHPITPLRLRFNALWWFYQNPPDPRGEPMCKRPSPYKILVERVEFIELFQRSARTIDRMLAIVREAAFIKRYGKITVEKFCALNGLPEDKIQQQLHEIFLKKWNKHK